MELQHLIISKKYKISFRTAGGQVIIKRGTLIDNTPEFICIDDVQTGISYTHKSLVLTAEVLKEDGKFI